MSGAKKIIIKQTRKSDSREYHLLYWAGSATGKRSLTMGSLPIGRVHQEGWDIPTAGCVG